MHPDRLNNPTDPNLAVFIMRTGDGTHTGILHRMKGELIIQDVMWHEMFRSEPCRLRPEFVAFALEEEVENDVRGMCRLIHERQHSPDPSKRYRIPYAFRHGNANSFGRAAGELMLVDGLGLTCSTFVLTVFQSVGVPLLSFDGWKMREGDNARHETLLEKMRNGIPEFGIPPAQAEHVERVQSELPCVRVRPEEAAATALCNDHPFTFAQLTPAGEWLLAQLQPTVPRP
jgi:hypothetical protein